MKGPHVGMVIGFATGACLSFKPFQGDNAQIDARGDGLVDSGPRMLGAVTFAANGSGGTVIGPFYTVLFNNDEGPAYHAIDAISIGTHPVLENSQTSCSADRAAGIGLGPGQPFTYDSHGKGSNTRNTFTHVLDGPAIVKTQLVWQASFLNSASATVTIDGVTLYTFFPDGQTYRLDAQFKSNPVHFSGDDIDCALGAGQPLKPKTFTTLVTGGAFYTASGTSITPPSASGITHGCVEYSGRAVAFSWPDNQTTVEQTNSNVAVSFSDSFDASAPLSYTGFDFPSKTTQMVLGNGSGCSDSNVQTAHEPLDRAIRWDSHAMWFLSVNQIPRHIAADGIFGGANGSDGSAGGLAVTSPVTITGMVPDPFAVWLDFGAAVDDIVVSRPDSMPPNYVKQKVTGTAGQFVIWFPDPLPAGNSTTITITTM